MKSFVCYQSSPVRFLRFQAIATFWTCFFLFTIVQVTLFNCEPENNKKKILPFFENIINNNKKARETQTFSKMKILFNETNE